MEKSNQNQPLQVSSGNLIQDSPGNLKLTENAELRTVKELPLDAVRPFLSIPDYQTPITSNYPIVVQAEELICIDGWHLIEKAKAATKSSLTCLIIQPNTLSDCDVAIRKVGCRIKTEGGEASYSEKMRAVKSLYDYLLTHLDNPQTFTHGGNRKNISHDDVISQMVNGLKLKRNKILGYKRHSESLNDAALTEMIKGKAGKNFFESIQRKKTTKVLDLKSENLPQDQITERISEFVTQELAEFNNEKNSETAENPQPTPEQNPKPAKEEKPNQEFSHWTGRTIDTETLPTTLAEIQTAIIQFAQQLMTFGQTSITDEKQFIETIGSYAEKLLFLYDLAKNIQKTKKEN
jgi:hypothetical protein